MLATCALIVLGFGSRPEDYMGGHDHQEEHDHKEDGTWDGAGATEEMRPICSLTVWDPTPAECTDYVAALGCDATYGATCPDGTVLLPDGTPLPAEATLSGGCSADCPPTAEECEDCVACAECAACVTDPTACAAGTDLFQTCTVDCAAPAQAGPYADLCATEKCIVTCAGDACAGCDTDPMKCYPGGEKYESCVDAGCTECQACEGCIADPTLCAPANPGGSLGYCARCAALGR